MKLFLNLLMTVSLMAGQFAAPPTSTGSVRRLQEPPTPTAIATATTSETATASETATEIPIASETVAPTETETATQTETASETPSATVTPTASETATETPTATETASETPTVTATQTPLATSTGTASPTPKSDVILTLSAAPNYILPGSKVMLQWEITGLTGLQNAPDYTIQFLFPQGVTPKVEKGAAYNEKDNILTVTIKDAKGQFQIGAQETIAEQIEITATLFKKEEALTRASLILAGKEEFTIGAAGGEIRTGDEKIKIKFPQGVMADDAAVQIGPPSGDAVPEYSLSGRPFEIKARDKKNGADLHQFDREITIEVSLEDYVIPEGAESDVHLYWYNPELKAWEAMASWMDSETRTLRAFTDHFSIFDVDINDWQASRMPSVDSFQVSNFSGAATYSLPIEVPAGPGGLQPSLALNYNSQIVDSATTKTQASWVGMGWSFDTSSIERDVNGTTEYTGDDSYFLNVNGVSSRLAVDSLGKWHTSDENFWRIDFNGDNTWTVWDKQGNTYYFEKTLNLTHFVDEEDTNHETCGRTLSLPYRWALTRVRNIHGKELTYSYSTETKQINYLIWTWNQTKGIDECRPMGWATTETALYLDSITYPNGRYRVRFERELRADYPIEWDTDPVHHSYERSRLKTIYVEQDADGNGVFETYIRSYTLNYTAPDNTANLIFPGASYTAGGKMSTLSSVQERGVGLTAALPAQTFFYGDNMHLKRAENGYGGAVEFDYEPWYYTADARESYKATYAYPGEGDYIGIPYVGIQMPYSQYIPVKPGGAYLLTALAPADFRVRLFNGATFEDSAYSPNPSKFFILPASASKAEAYMQTPTGNGTVLQNSYFWALTTIYRVKTKRLYSVPSAPGSATPYTYTYVYEGAAVNDGTHSAIAALYCSPTSTTCRDLVEDFSEFRGHASVTETGPDGLKTKQSFAQDDVLKGRLNWVCAFDPAWFPMNCTVNTYNPPNPLSVVMPQTNSSPAIPYVGFGRYFIYASKVEQRSDYANTSGTSYQHSTFTEYTYGDNYGNLTMKQEYDGAALYRTTNYIYYPNTANNLNLTGLVALQKISDAAGALQAQTLNIYDLNSVFDAVPTQGRLSVVRNWVRYVSGSPSEYAQVNYGYDEYGNQTSVTTYQGFGTSTSRPTTGAAMTSMVYNDGGYNTYPTTITNAKGHPTTFIYDYTKGVPLTETDPNNAVTSATYDSFGRMTSLTRPLVAGASLTMTYSNAPYTATTPFTTTITQKIDAAQSMTLTRKYDGMGRVMQTNSGGILTDTIYTSATSTKQSMPYTAGETVYYTTTSTTFSLGARTTKVTAPDGTFTSAVTDGLVITQYDAKNNKTITTNDVWGRTTKVDAPSGPDITYTYDELNHLETATRGGLITTLTYNGLGQKISMTDPDMGTWIYTYDGAGNLKTQKDARLCVLTMTYDLLNRLTDKISSGAGCVTQVDINYVYDTGTSGIGRRTSMTDASGSTSWLYDLRGRVTSETKTISGAPSSFITSWTYNWADQPLKMTYPDGEQVTTAYNAKMQVNSVIGTSVYVASSVYDSAGRLTEREYGNGTGNGYQYYPWTTQGGRLEYLVSGTDFSLSGAFQILNYAYDNSGNVTNIQSMLDGESQAYTYDPLDRLTSWNLNGVSENYAYNAATGNLSSKAGASYTYDTSHPHAVKQVVTNGGSSGTGKTISIRAFSTVCGGIGATMELWVNGVKSATWTNVATSWTIYSQGGITLSGKDKIEVVFTNDCSTDGDRNLYVDYVVVDGTTIQSEGGSAVIDRGTGSAAFDGLDMLAGGQSLFWNSALRFMLGTETFAGSYDANGNQTTRIIGADTFNLAYDAENRLTQVKKNAVVIATFTYDGDGNRVKSTIGGANTFFIGNYYEQTGSVHTRYHYAGGQRIAMRTNASGVWATTYILGDHLGSTSITTNSAGAKVSETRYKPWGEVRFQWGVTPTDYTYTGQYSNTADFGLMYYNARWYDPVIGRFAQADTIVPAGVQGYDRYAYVNNNPVKYTDPSGHCTAGGFWMDDSSSACQYGQGQGDDDEENSGGGGNPSGESSGGDTYRDDLIGPPQPKNRDNYWSCYSIGSSTYCDGRLAGILPYNEHLNGTVTTADLHSLTSAIQVNNTNFESLMAKLSLIPFVSWVTAFLSFEDPSGTEAFAQKIDDGLIEYALVNDQTSTVIYSFDQFGAKEMEGNLSISTEGYGSVSITLSGFDALNAKIWHDMMWGGQ